MIDKRKYRRYIVEGMGLFAKTIFNTDVEVLDISTSGGSVRGAKRFVMGNEYTFKLEDKDGLISVKGVIVWEKLTGTRDLGGGEAMPIYTAGIEFKNGLADKMEDIKKLLVDKVKERRLSSMRVRIPQGMAVLSHQETCSIKDVSLGGARIETEQEPSEGAVFPLELVIAEGEGPISCKGRVAFYLEMPEQTPRRYSVGVEFMDMSGEDKSRLARFIEILPADIGETTL